MNNYYYKSWIDAINKFTWKNFKSWFNFAMLWFSFNSYYSEKYANIEGEWNQIKQFANDNKNLYESLFSKEKTGFSNVLKEFQQTGSYGRDGVKDMRPNSTKYVKFDNEHKSCEDFFRVLYQIRCNFFHGDKQPFYEEDIKLVDWAYKYFSIFWESFLNDQEKRN
ncbi:MAG: hypothetical protein QW735_03530 [archaeon]